MFLTKVAIAKHLGVSRGAVYALIKNDPTFPEPVLITPSCPRWLDAAIDAWALARSEAVNQKPKGDRAA